MTDDDAKLPLDLRRRYGRQIRLAEIGEAGQVKICAAKDVRLASSSRPASAIEQRYLTAAGMRVECNSSDPTHLSETLATLGIRHHAAAEVAEGALAALITMRDVLGVGVKTS